MKITNLTDMPLTLPISNQVLRPGIVTLVKRWDVIKGHSTVKAWLQANVLKVDEGRPVVVAEEAVPAMGEPAQGGETFAAAPEADILDELRSDYKDATGKSADKRWSEARLREEIAKADRD